AGSSSRRAARPQISIESEAASTGQMTCPAEDRKSNNATVHPWTSLTEFRWPGDAKSMARGEEGLRRSLKVFSYSVYLPSLHRFLLENSSQKKMQSGPDFALAHLHP